MTLLGHSWGGGLAALYAAAHPQSVAKLILVDAVPPRFHPFAIDQNHARLAGFDSATRARIDILMQAALSDTARDKPARGCDESGYSFSRSRGSCARYRCTGTRIA